MDSSPPPPTPSSRPIHPKAMPVILTTPAEVDLWLEGRRSTRSICNGRCPTSALGIVAKGEKEDGAAA